MYSTDALQLQYAMCISANCDVCQSGTCDFWDYMRYAHVQDVAVYYSWHDMAHCNQNQEVRSVVILQTLQEEGEGVFA